MPKTFRTHTAACTYIVGTDPTTHFVIRCVQNTINWLKQDLFSFSIHSFFFWSMAVNLMGGGWITPHPRVPRPTLTGITVVKSSHRTCGRCRKGGWSRRVTPFFMGWSGRVPPFFWWWGYPHPRKKGGVGGGGYPPFRAMGWMVSPS